MKSYRLFVEFSPPRGRAFALLQETAQRAEDKLEAICRQRSVDFWLTYVRRLALIVRHWEEGWVPYSTLAVIKWAEWETSDSLGEVNRDGSYGLAYILTGDGVNDCCDVATLGRLLAQLAACSRWVGKGANVEVLSSGAIAPAIPTDVREAVDWYENRRPTQALLADEGVFAEDGAFDDAEFRSRPFFEFGEPREGNDCLFLLRTRQSFPILLGLRPADARPIVRVLQHYAEAIQDRFAVSVDAIMHVLHAFSTLLLWTVVFPDHGEGLAYSGDPLDPAFSHRFGFTLGLFRKGYVRFPREYLEKSLASIVVPPFSNSEEQAKSHVRDFFRAFAVTDAMRDRIDLRRLEPLPLLYEVAGKYCYFDLIWLDDFVRFLVVGAKEWYSTQHGDRFTLSVKRLLNSQAPDVEIVAHKHTFVLASGERFEIDLLVKAGGALYVIECKAFAKSRMFWIGDPEATNRRTQRLRAAVLQAKQAAERIGLLSSVDSGRGPVQWVVCTPAQEFLRPIDCYGMLAPDIPRVCTAEELAKFLSDPSVRGLTSG